MTVSISSLRSHIKSKEAELKSVEGKLSKAGIGALLTKNPLIGAAAGAYLSREKSEKERLTREIDDLKRKIQDNEKQISQLKQKQSQLRNNLQNDKMKLRTDAQQKRNDLERQKQNESDTAKLRDIATQISRTQGDEDIAERQVDRNVELEVATIQNEINQLTF